MKIETEFSIGDEVWVICRGTKTIGRYEVIGPKKIDYIEVCVDGDIVQENYECKCLSGFYFPDELFKTREAAEIAAEVLNRWPL